MAYCEQSEIAGLLPREYLVEALDDDRDGLPDDAAWDTVQANVSLAIEGPLSARYPVPFASPAPKLVRHAALVLTMEILYARRGVPADQNPWKEQADEIRATLGKIGEGKMPLSASSVPAHPAITVISEPSRTHSAQGKVAI